MVSSGNLCWYSCVCSEADLMHNGNGIKRRGENGEHVLHGNEQFRHRQPHAKPASP